MFNDTHRWSVTKRCSDFNRTVDVCHIIKARFAFKGFEVVAKEVVELIQCALLVWVFTITRIERFGAYDELFLTKTIVKALVHVVGDHTVIRSRMLECFDHQISSKF